MARRAFLGGVTLAVVAPAGPIRAQPARGVHRLGILTVSSEGASHQSRAHQLVPTALRELGYVEGQSLGVDRRSAEGKLERLPALARELAALRPHVMLGISPAAVDALRDHAPGIPVIMFAAVDPVARGWVRSLARPGGLITGVVLTPDTLLATKRLELLRQGAPRATRIAALTSEEPHAQEEAHVAQRGGPTAGATVVVVEVRAGGYERAFEKMAADRVQGLIVVASPILNRDRKQIMALAVRYRLPAIYQWSEHVDEGGLMSYGSNIKTLAARAAVFIDRVLKGAKPGDLPVEQPRDFELVLNRKTARALGLTLPPALLAQADRLVD
jgi:putative ABC transport system substrate-binding protein